VALSFGWSLLLLREFKWQIDCIGDYFQHMEEYKNNIHYSSSLMKPEEAEKKSVLSECEICMDKSMLVFNICGHGYCRRCWLEYID
jgi:hypothetical protein